MNTSAKVFASPLALVGVVLALCGTSSGHAILAHQEITRDAGLVWAAAPGELALHLAGSGSVDPLGVVSYALGDDTVTGSGDEDQEFNYLLHCTLLSFAVTGSGSCTFGPRYTNGVFEHFWDPDQPNAGGPLAYDQGFQDPAVNAGQRQASSYRKAREIWDTRVICRYTGRDPHGAVCPVDRNEAYYWLGRVAHLLEDLTVPAHVHNARHDPPAAVLGQVDPFEEFVLREYMAGAADDYLALASLSGGEYRYEALPGIDQQAAFAWTDVHPDATDLFKLFWHAAQRTQYYATGGTVRARPGDAGAYRRWADGSGAAFDPSLWAADAIDPVASPADVSDALPRIASALVPHALRAVGGLYRLFWHETHALSVAVNQSEFFAGDRLAVRVLNDMAENTGDLYLAVEQPDGSILVFDGDRWDWPMVPVRHGATLTAGAVVEFTARLDSSIAPGTYTFYAVLAIADSDPTDLGNWLSNLARASFTFSAPASSARR